MLDKEFKEYVEKRCAEEPFEVPAFDGFFTDEELAGTTKPHRTVALWSRIAATAAIAAAVALLIILKPTVSTETEPSEMEDWIVSQNDETGLTDETPTVEEGVEITDHFLATATPSKLRTKNQAPQSVVTTSSNDNDATVNSEFATPKDAAATAEGQPAIQELEDGVTSMAQASESTHTDEIWEQNVQAAKDAKKKHKKVATISAAFNCNNSLMAYNASSQSTVSMITRNYQSGSILRSASINRNEWKIPNNLGMTRSEIAAYTPVYNLPLTGSFGISFPIGKFFDLRTGLTYTYLSANTYGKMDNSQSFSLYQHLHYIGIPLQFAFNILDNVFGLYVSAGGGVEKGLAGVQYSHVYDADGQQASCEKLTQSVAGLQPYVSFNVGASYRIAEHLKIYVEPSISYYFDTNQPISVRTKRPLYLGLGAGLRFATR